MELAIGYVNKMKWRGGDPYIQPASTCFDMIIYIFYVHS